MRNAIIRKKRLKAERIVDDYMRMPSRIVLGAVDKSDAWVDNAWQQQNAGMIWQVARASLLSPA